VGVQKHGSREGSEGGEDPSLREGWFSGQYKDKNDGAKRTANPQKHHAEKGTWQKRPKRPLVKSLSEIWWGREGIPWNTQGMNVRSRAKIPKFQRGETHFNIIVY